MNLLAPAKDWKHATWAERIDACGSMLYLHGYITAAQRSKITLRLEKQLAPAGETRRAETALAGSVHEHAIGEAEAPESHRVTQDYNPSEDTRLGYAVAIDTLRQQFEAARAERPGLTADVWEAERRAGR